MPNKKDIPTLQEGWEYVETTPKNIRLIGPNNEVHGLISKRFLYYSYKTCKKPLIEAIDFDKYQAMHLLAKYVGALDTQVLPALDTSVSSNCLLIDEIKNNLKAIETQKEELKELVTLTKENIQKAFTQGLTENNISVRWYIPDYKDTYNTNITLSYFTIGSQKDIKLKYLTREKRYVWYWIEYENRNTYYNDYINPPLDPQIVVNVLKFFSEETGIDILVNLANDEDRDRDVLVKDLP
jgi:hypothetical protein